MLDRRELIPPKDYATMPIEEAVAWWARNCPGRELETCAECEYSGYGLETRCSHPLHPRNRKRRKGGWL